MKIPIEIKIKHFQFSNSFLPQSFRLLLLLRLLLHDWSSVNDWSWEMFMTVCRIPRVATGTGETTALGIKCDIFLRSVKVEKINCCWLLHFLTRLFLLDSFFFADRRLVDAFELVASVDDHNRILSGISWLYPFSINF